jgi:hypothetical protein
MQLFAYLRKEFSKTVVVLAMTLQVINISIDPADQFTGAEDMAINEIESCVELVLEVVLDYHGAIDETDEADDSTQRHASNIILFTLKTSSLISEKPYRIVSVKNAYGYFSQFTSLSLPIVSPPPKHTASATSA